MTIETDDEKKQALLAAEEAEREQNEREKKKGGKSGSASGGVSRVIVSEEDTEESAQRKRDEGEGDSDSFGRGKAGAGAGAIRLPPQKLKEVMADWRHLDVSAVVEAVAEFFSDWPMRAAANLSVAWTKTRANPKSFAIVNWVIEAGKSAVRELARTRERTRGAGADSRKLFMRTRPGIKAGIAARPGPTTAG